MDKVVTVKLTLLATAFAAAVSSSPVAAEEILGCTWKTGAVETYRVGGETWQYWASDERVWSDVPCQLFNQSGSITCADLSDDSAYRYHTVLNDLVRNDAGEVEYEHRGQAIMIIDRKSGWANSNAGIESRWSDPPNTESHHFDNHAICKAVSDPALGLRSAPG